VSTLRWVRLDTSLPRNPKVLGLLQEREGHRAAFAYVCALAYCGEQGTEGFVPREALSLLHARQSDARALIDAGLWVEEAGGWTIPDWAEFQPTTAQMQARTNKARKAAAARWSKREAGKA
jgi:hypothetical protein